MSGGWNACANCQATQGQCIDRQQDYNPRVRKINDCCDACSHPLVGLDPWANPDNYDRWKQIPLISVTQQGKLRLVAPCPAAFSPMRPWTGETRFRTGRGWTP